MGSILAANFRVIKKSERKLSKNNYSFLVNVSFAIKINLVSSIPTAPFFIIPKSLKAISSKKSWASLVMVARTWIFSSVFHFCSYISSSGVFEGMRTCVFVAMFNILCVYLYIYYSQVHEYSSTQIHKFIRRLIQNKINKYMSTQVHMT